MGRRAKATPLTALTEPHGAPAKALGQHVVARTPGPRPDRQPASGRSPAERELIEILAFGISRPSLREALRALAVRA